LNVLGARFKRCVHFALFFKQMLSNDKSVDRNVQVGVVRLIVLFVMFLLRLSLRFLCFSIFRTNYSLIDELNTFFYTGCSKFIFSCKLCNKPRE
jgi:hypothetical protein